MKGQCVAELLQIARLSDYLISKVGPDQNTVKNSTVLFILSLGLCSGCIAATLWSGKIFKSRLLKTVNIKNSQNSPLIICASNKIYHICLIINVSVIKIPFLI